MKSYMIMDGQWGSTGKGLLAGYLARNVYIPDTVVCNFGPNAGHTFVTKDGVVVLTKQLPTAICAPSVRNILIGPGSIINLDILRKELKKFETMLCDKRILIHPRAAIVHQRHKDLEANVLASVSSTFSGTGAAVADKVMRKEHAIIANMTQDLVCSEDEYNTAITDAEILQIESAQGFELGINTGFSYPYCTSRDVTPAQILSDCAVPMWVDPEIWVTMRVHPIRVGHQYDKQGRKIGDSGPVYNDQQELDWADIEFAPAPERTTVTNKIRRIFTFSEIGCRRMLNFVRPDHIFLNFVNYLEANPSFESKVTSEWVNKIEQIAEEVAYPIPVSLIGTGPQESDIISREG